MPAYSFTALDDQGHSRKGTLEADSAKSARAQLRAQQFIPLTVDLLSGSARSDSAAANASPWWQSKVLRGNGLALWTRQLAELVHAGLPLEQALGSLSEEAESEALRNLNAALRAAVHGGSSFARALEQYPREFGSVYTAVVGAGEQSGSWPWCWCAWPMTWKNGRPCAPRWWGPRCIRPSCQPWRW